MAFYFMLFVWHTMQFAQYNSSHAAKYAEICNLLAFDRLGNSRFNYNDGLFATKCLLLYYQSKIFILSNINILK